MSSSGRQARAGVIYSLNSSVTERGENLARYLSVCMTKGGWCEKVYLLGLNFTSTETKKQSIKCNPFQVLRRDGQVLGSEDVKETTDTSVLPECDVIFLCCDVLDIDKCASTVAVALKKEEKNNTVIVRLESSLKRMDGFEKTHFAEKIVLQGGACFQVVKDKQGVLTTLSNGSIFIERLAYDILITYIITYK